jgi:hypothetical protein
MSRLETVATGVPAVATAVVGTVIGGCIAAIGNTVAMTKVTITGWREGLNKVQLNYLLRQHTQCRLADAKSAVDELLAGGSLTYEFPDDDSASAFCRSASAVGAVCSMGLGTGASEQHSATLLRS